MQKHCVAFALALAIVGAAPQALAQKGTESDSSSSGVPPANPDAVGVGLDGEKHEEKKKTETKEESSGSGDTFDVAERPGQTYYFIGLRYGLTVIPKFMVNIFVNEGATFTS